MPLKAKYLYYLLKVVAQNIIVLVVITFAVVFIAVEKEKLRWVLHKRSETRKLSSSPKFQREQVKITNAVQSMNRVIRRIEGELGKRHESLGPVVVLRDFLKNSALPRTHTEYYYRKWKAMEGAYMVAMEDEIR